MLAAELPDTGDKDMASALEEKLLDLLKSQGLQAGRERADLAKSFSDSLKGLRNEIRVIVILAFILLAARDGVLTHLEFGALKVTTAQAATSAAPSLANPEPDTTSSTTVVPDPQVIPNP